MNPRAALAWTCVVFLASGGAALGYQSAWSRLLSVGLGHELPAVLGVVSGIFGGLALGAWMLDGRIRHAQRPGRFAAFLEFVIGGWAAVTAFLIPILSDWAPRWTGVAPSPTQYGLLAFLLPFLSLLPATIAMGATLPAVERFASPMVPDRRVLGTLYGANTLGAVVGVIVSTFLLVPGWGNQTTILVLGAVNVGCGLAFLWLDRHAPRAAANPIVPPGKIATQRRLCVTVFTTGLLGLGYEVVGLRLLSRVLENTVYTYAVILAVFLAATAAGAAWFQRSCRGQRQSGRISGLLIALAAATLAGAWALWFAAGIYGALRNSLGDALAATLLSEGLVALLVFGLPAFLMGILFSLLVQSAALEGGSVGRVVALNLLGGALAAPVCAFGLLPALGARWTWALMGLGYLVLIPKFGGFVKVAWALPVILAWTLPQRFPRPELPAGGREIEFHEGRLDSVSVLGFFDGNRSLWVNQRFGMGGTGSWIAERRQGQIPLCLHPNPERALFLGVGTGITFAGAGAHPRLRADGVELIPEVVEVHRHFAPWNDLPADGRLRLFVADARRFVRATSDRFDVIVADLFHPARDGAGLLYTREHFQAVRGRLADGGLFCQWLPLYQLDLPRLRLITRTFLSVFPESSAWLLRLNLDTPVMGLVSRADSGRYPVDWLERRSTEKLLGEELRRIGLADSWQLLGGFLGGKEALRRFAGGEAALNTDDRPLVIFEAPLNGVRRSGRSYESLLNLLAEFHPDPADIVEGQSGREKLAGYFRARDAYIRGLVAEEEGRLAESIDRYVESVRASAVFTTGYARCLTLAMQQSAADRPAARRLLERLIEARPERPVAADLLKRLSEE